MEIKIRYDDTFTTIEVAEEDCTLMIDADYEAQLAEAEDKTAVKRRSVQEIMDERFNKPEYNNWHQFDRHSASAGLPKRTVTGKRFSNGDSVDEFSDHMELYPTTADIDALEAELEYEEVCRTVRSKLKPQQAELFIAVHLDGVPLKDYAARIGIAASTACEKLKRAEKNLKKFFEKHEF